VGAEARTCCGWRETHERGALGDGTLSSWRIKFFAPQIRSLSLNVHPQTPQNFTVKLRVDGLALGDEFTMNNAADVEKHDENGFH
jgi:hypothetical protein